MEVSSAKSWWMLTVDETSLDKSFMWIKKNKDPNIEPCDTPASTGAYVEDWPFSKSC